MMSTSTNPINSDKYEGLAELCPNNMVNCLRTSIHMTKRVITPYISARKMTKKSVILEDQFFDYYAAQKPSILTCDLSMFLNNQVDLHRALNETVDILVAILKAEGAFVYIVNESVGQLYLSTKNSADLKNIFWPISPGTTLAAFVAHSKEVVVTNDVLNDPRFPQGIGNEDILIKSAICIPIVTPDDECVAIIELHRKIESESFGVLDLRTCTMLSGWIGTAIYQNSQQLILQKQQELNNYLLDLIKSFFANNLVLDKFITDIVNFAKVVLEAEHGSLYVINNKHGELSAELYEEGIYVENSIVLLKKNLEVNMNTQDDIPSAVAREGVTRIVMGEHKSLLSFRKKGIIAKSVLCMPIKGINEVLGVIQLVNKKSGEFFTKKDEKLCEIFCTYCAFALRYTQLYENKLFYKNKNKVLEEMLSHHMKPCIHDLTNVMTQPNIVGLPQNFNQFDWYINDEHIHILPHLVMYMIQKISPEYQIEVPLLINFILTVQKSYRRLPYHNFEHAFMFCHTMYIILRRHKEYFSSVEMKALLIAGICHDIDHRGYTNNFMHLIGHPLSELYGESTMENHHFEVTLYILNDLKIFGDCPAEVYKTFVREIREAIIATDLPVYLKHRTELYEICSKNQFNWTNEYHRQLLKSIMMTSADLSGQCKPFSIAKRITENLYREFYAEGDHEKQMELCPLSIMDRKQKDMIPLDQVQFLTVIVMPCTLLLSKLLPKCLPLYKGCLTLRNTWQEIFDSRGHKVWYREDTLVQ